MMVPFDSAPFGRITTLLSGVRIFVAVIFTSTTLPMMPCASMKSPALKGLKASNMIPPAKFCTVPDSAIPIAKPPAARSAAIEVVSTPSVLIEITISKTMSEMVTNEVTNEAIVFSVLRRSNRCFNPTLTHLTRKKPITRMSNAANKDKQKCVILSWNICQKPSGSVRAYSIICRAPWRTESEVSFCCSCATVATARFSKSSRSNILIVFYQPHERVPHL